MPCKTVLEVNDNSGRRIPDRLTFELKELRLKLYSFDSSTAPSIPLLLIPLVSLLLHPSTSLSLYLSLALASLSLLPTLFLLFSLLPLFLFPPPFSPSPHFISPLEEVSFAVGSMTRTH